MVEQEDPGRGGVLKITLQRHPAMATAPQLPQRPSPSSRLQVHYDTRPHGNHTCQGLDLLLHQAPKDVGVEARQLQQVGGPLAALSSLPSLDRDGLDQVLHHLHGPQRRRQPAVPGLRWERGGRHLGESQRMGVGGRVDEIFYKEN